MSRYVPLRKGTQWWAAPSYVPQPPHLAEWQTWVNRDNHPLIDFAVFIGLMMVVGAVAKLMQWERNAAAYCTRPLRNLWRHSKTGVGGSASFAGLLDEWEPAMQWKPGRIMLGTSLYEPGQRLGHWDDRHIITIATTRSGKGRSCIIPNLLTWPGSALVIDPKGENAAVTARARRQLGQSVHIVDPFKLLETEPPHGLGLDPEKFPRHRLNPLMEIRLDDPEAVDQIRKLAAALVMISPNANPFWDESSRNILEGVIAHVTSSPDIPDTDSTVYLVIPPDYLETHARYLRLFITLALKAAGRGRKGKHSMLFVLDEFAGAR